MLKIEALTKKYPGSNKGVENLSLHIEPGDIYAFIGHNGAGKTTTLKSIVGIHPFDSGEIFVDGISVRENMIECKRRLAYIPDNPDIFEYLTGIQYLNFIADVFGVSEEERRSEIAEYAEKFEISDSLGNLISSYSHGMKQKLALISAFIHSPKLLILDEPFVGLDPKASLTLKNEMKALCEVGGAVFFSTHVLEVAEKLCNKVAVIKDGKLITSGEMSKVLAENESLEELFMEVAVDAE